MRHSQMTASCNYNKVFDNEDEEQDKEEYTKVNVGLELKIKELEEKLSAYTNNDEMTDEKKHYKKKRSDIIYNLNKKGRTPRDDTLLKYNITYDDKKELYI